MTKLSSLYSGEHLTVNSQHIDYDYDFGIIEEEVVTI